MGTRDKQGFHRSRAPFQEHGGYTKRMVFTYSGMEAEGVMEKENMEKSSMIEEGAHRG